MEPAAGPDDVPHLREFALPFTFVPVPDDINEETTSSLGLPHAVVYDELKTALAFKEALEKASLDEDGFDEDTLYRLRNPLETPVDADPRLQDRGFKFALRVFFDTATASDSLYSSICLSYEAEHPDSSMPSHHNMKKFIAELTGITPITRDMCPHSCVGYTGPWSDLENCPVCGEARYEDNPGSERKPRRTFDTIPIGPQLVAQSRDPKNAERMQHRKKQTARILEALRKNGYVTDEYSDVYYGEDYIQGVESGTIGEDDIVVMLSMDGAQLYRNKQSDCWMYIWVILNLAPDQRYKLKYILPGGVIPGPNKPSHVDSFLFPGLHHFAALAKEKLAVWDAAQMRVFYQKLFLLLATADGPGMTYLNGLVGHQGAQGCRLFCRLRGRHKPGATTYYPVLLKPDNYAVEGCDGGDYNLLEHAPDTTAQIIERYERSLEELLTAQNDSQYKKLRLKTGIAKPSLFRGLPQGSFLGTPVGFPADQMHLVSLNLTDLLVSLFRGTIKCETTDKKTEWGFAVLQGDAWKTHGAQVADCTRFLPGSFDRPPRNPAEKIKSGYKAWEFLMYIFGLGPCLFYASPLPIEFFRNFCRLVRAIRITLAYTIHADDLVEAHNHFVQFSTEFEELYYKRRPDRLHFIRQSIHALSHICPEVHRLGPQACYTQWVMERAIGSFVQELRNHSNPYANLSERFIRRAQLNALKAMFPGLEHSKYKTGEYPKGAEEVGSGYVLLRAVDAKEHTIRTAEGKALRDYLRKHDPVNGRRYKKGHTFRVKRWARLLLPNGQIARSYWKEGGKPRSSKLRVSRNVKIIHNGEIRYGEVQYFLQLNIGAQKQAVALLSLWSLPEPQLLELSYSTIHSCLPGGDEGLVIVPVHCIQSVVAMIPHPAHIPSNDGHIEYRPVNVAGRWCVVEKPGLEVAYHAGRNEDIFAQDEGNGEGGQGSAETMRGDD